MKNYEQLRSMCLHILSGCTHRDIAKKFGVSASLVSVYKRRMLENGEMVPGSNGLKKLDSLSEDELINIIFPTAVRNPDGGIKSFTVSRPRHNTLMPNFDVIAMTLLESRVSKKFCYTDYLCECERQQKDPISRSDFYEKLRIKLKAIKGPKIYMQQERQYGEEVCIDYCGDTVPYIDQGVKRKGVVCVLTWSASYYSFAIIIPSQSTEDTCFAIGQAFKFFKYLPITLHCDNAKSMVTSHTKGAEARFNDSFAYFMERLGVSLYASNPYNPSEKSCVEAVVGMIERNVLPRMEYDPTLSLEALNARLMALINEHINNAPYSSVIKKSRFELYNTYEIVKARELTGTIPSFYRHFYSLKVNSNYRVVIEGKTYSVPYNFAGQFVAADICKNIVRIYNDNEVIATHPIVTDVSDSVKLEHMPEAHRAVATSRIEYPDAQSILEKATSISEMAFRFCKYTLEKKDFKDAKKGCIRIINKYTCRNHPPKEYLDEAINRMFMSTENYWNSNTVMTILEEIKGEMIATGKLSYQSDLSFVSNPEFANLRRSQGNMGETSIASDESNSSTTKNDVTSSTAVTNSETDDAKKIRSANSLCDNYSLQ